LGGRPAPARRDEDYAVTIDLKLLATVFATVLLAELGDRTQLATLLFAADREASKAVVFFGAALALVGASALGVLAGAWLSQHVGERVLHVATGLGFVAIGLWTLLKP
jgi:putative Ca2+/H+ antiporter (TMEM165/GDT1 family)